MSSLRYVFQSPPRPQTFRSSERTLAHLSPLRVLAYRVAPEGIAMPAVPIGLPPSAVPLLETQEQGNIYSIDFSPRLATGETIIAATATVLSGPSTALLDVTPTVLQGSALVLPAPTSVSVPAPLTAAGAALHNPVVGTTYTLRLAVTTTAGRTLQDRIINIVCDD